MRGLTTSIDATTNIPSVVDRARAGFVSFERQVAGIGARFSTGFKDIFLGFFAPMALFQTAMGFITDGIAKAKQDAKEGLELIARGETEYATSEEKRTAAFFKAKKAREDEMEMVRKGKIAITEQVINTPEGGRLFEAEAKRRGIIDPEARDLLLAQLRNDPEFQNKALKAFLESPEGKAYQPIFGDKKDNAFKTPEGFSNVVGVGPSPVMEAMAAQLEEAQKQTALLEKIAGGDNASGWMNKDSK